MPVYVSVLVRSPIGVEPRTRGSLNLLKLKRRFQARVLEGSEANKGMLRRVKDYVTWGEVDEETLELLLKTRAHGQNRQHLTDNWAKENFNVAGIDELSKALVSEKMNLKELAKAGVHPVLGLHPPKGGFKASTRRPFKDKGELGYRGAAIQRLLRQMC